jgi:tetratricopeptide (TPR) repeat protein
MSGALADYEEGMKIARTLVEKDKDNSRSPRDLAISLDKAGDTKLKLTDAKGALAYFEEGLAIRKAIADADKSNYTYRRDVSLTLDRIGAANLDLDDIPASLAAAEESLAIARSATRWLSRKAPDCCSNRSTRVVLPWSTWAMMAILRRFMGA